MIETEVDTSQFQGMIAMLAALNGGDLKAAVDGEAARILSGAVKLAKKSTPEQLRKSAKHRNRYGYTRTEKAKSEQATRWK